MIEINTPIHADWLDIAQEIDDESIDLILCDLPFECTKNHWDIHIPFDFLWKQYMRIIKPNGAIVLNSQGIFSAKLILSNEKYYRYSLVWKKTTPTGHLNAKRMFLRSHEDIQVFYKNLPTYNPQKTTGHVRKVSSAEHKRNSKKTTNYGEHKLTSYDSTERYPTSVLCFPTDKQKSNISPTQKPVALNEYLIKTYSNEGDLILDNCAGSFTTAIAAQNLNRNWICIEKDDEMFLKGSERVLQNKIRLENINVNC